MNQNAENLEQATRFLDNLRGLHGEEERLRGLSLAAIAGSSDAMAHLRMIEAGMDLVQVLGRGTPAPTPAQQTVQMVGIRLFNGAAASLKLGQCGYYQLAFSLVRDLLETTHLLDYFLLEPTAIAVFECGGDAAKKKFQPAAVRKALDARDGFTKRARGATYQRYSEYAAHPTYSGVQLVATNPDRLATYGPFFDAATLNHFLFDLAKFMTHASAVFMAHFADVEGPCQEAMVEFAALTEQWRKAYLARERA